jgi:hypothetical protein
MALSPGHARRCHAITAAAIACPETYGSLPAAVADIRLLNAAKAFQGLSHQSAAWNWLQEQQRPEVLAQFAELYRADPAVKPEASPSPGKTTNPLSGFPFFDQKDNGPQGWRQCQTSSIAMCLAYLKVPGIRDDLDYLRVVQQFGDTTSQAAHQQALAKLGVRARFRQNMTDGELQAEIKAGLPVAIGVLHHGSVSAPSGGGHYVAVYGFDSTSWIVNDPYGELDLVNGGWSSQAPGAGRGQRYSFRNLNPRWLPEGPASGWGWAFS